MDRKSKNLHGAPEAALAERARALIEAMPYIHEFRGASMVIKYGGHAMVDPELKDSVVRDIVLMEAVGMNPIVVHGGGPEITRLMDRVGKKVEFIDGLRVTDRDTMELTEMVLAGKLNGELVSRINRAGGRAVGLSGKDAGLILAKQISLPTEGDNAVLLSQSKAKGSSARPKPKAREKGRAAAGGAARADIGFVGEITTINPEILDVLDEHKFIPVISPIGVDNEGNSYNINADTAAAEVAAAVKAAKLILLTDVSGVQRQADDPATLISTIERSEVETLIADKVITGGMIPKVRACADALDRGVGKTHIIDGRVPHALLLELFTEQGIGTQIVLRRDAAMRTSCQRTRSR